MPATTAATRAGAIGAAETTVATAAFTTTAAVAAAAFATTAVATATAAFTATAAVAAATTAAVATTAATTVAATATTEATARAGWTGFHGTCFVDDDVASTQRLTVHAVDGSLCICIATHLDKAKAFGATGVALHHDLGREDVTEC